VTPLPAYRRTPGRKDFPLPPPRATLLDRLEQAQIPVWAVGKLADLFAGRGIARQLPTRDNHEGMVRILEAYGALPDPGCWRPT